MKCRLFLTIFLALLFLQAAPQSAYPAIFASSYDIAPANSRIGIAPIGTFTARCVDAYTSEDLPCPFQVSLEGVICRAAGSPENTFCNHVDAYHRPTSRNDLEEPQKVIAIGGLTDAGQGSPTTILPVRMTPRYPPHYWFTYHSGEISGQVDVKAVGIAPPDGYWFIAPPCESRESCTILRTMDVGIRGFEKLRDPLPLPPPPPWPPGEEPSPDAWDGYVRCGWTTFCTEPVIDSPHNWRAHPHVHWGRFDFLDNLTRLGRLWYKNCCQPLVLSDISLPWGGLLDTKNDWQIPHKSHRYGIDADISRTSVPVNPSLQCDCGPKPTGSTIDPVWKKTALRKLAKKCGLRPMKDDPGHLIPAED
jgi:hypothetical protein